MSMSSSHYLVLLRYVGLRHGWVFPAAVSMEMGNWPGLCLADVWFPVVLG